MILYKNGDVIHESLKYNNNKQIIIIHVVNCNNGFGKGFVLSLKNKWST